MTSSNTPSQAGTYHGTCQAVKNKTQVFQRGLVSIFVKLMSKVAWIRVSNMIHGQT